MSTTSAGKRSTGASVCSSSKGNSDRRRSCETFCSSNSSCILQKRKPTHPLAAPLQTHPSSNLNAVRQRVLSAKLSKMKSIQNQLNDANFHLAELVKENRSLKILQKRQDRALKDYEGVNADLPKLIQSYEEEKRILMEKNKHLRKNLKEITEQLRLKNEEGNNLRDQVKHLTTLSKEKHLLDREKLTEELSDTKELLKKRDSEISVLNRKLMLETKNSKYKMANEMAKYRQTQKKLNEALLEIDHMSMAKNSSVKYLQKTGKRFPKFQSTSCTSLSNKAHNTSLELSGSTFNIQDDTAEEKDSSSGIKLESIVDYKSDKDTASPNVTLKSPAENIKARLTSTEQINSGLQRLSMDEKCDKNIKTQHTKSGQNSLEKVESRPNSSNRLEALSKSLHTILQKNGNKDIDQAVGNECKDIINSLKTLDTVVSKHTNDYKNSKLETDHLLQKLQEVDNIDNKLRRGNVNDDAKTQEDRTNNGWLEENELNDKIKKDANASKKTTKVSQEKKKQLLATLRAIDNGEVPENVMDRKTNLLKELFGESSQ